jgi:hypothetical protein
MDDDGMRMNGFESMGHRGLMMSGQAWDEELKKEWLWYLIWETL